MGVLIDVLRTVEFLAEGPPELAAGFSSVGRSRTLPKGHVVWRAGQRADAIVIPVSGELAALGRDSDGRGICYAFVGTGECVGIPAAMDGLPEPRDVRVIRGGEFFVVDRASFERFIDAHPSVRDRVIAGLSRLFRAGLDERDRDVFLPVHARVARFLLGHACVRQSDGARILVRETQPEIAIRLGSVREVVAREMASFGHAGLIRRTRHALFVTDWSALWDKAACTRDGTCSCEAEAAALRTRRFFVPAISGGPTSVADEVRVCCEQQPPVRACIASGCPLALAARPPGASWRHDDVGDAPRERRALASPQGTVAGSSIRRSASVSAAGVRASGRIDERGPGLARVSRVRNAGLPRAREEAAARSPAEEHEVRRRIDMYRRRVEGIESKFGAEERVPEEASVFRDLAETVR